MKTMKNVLAAVLIAAFIMPAMQGCKKGEEDPGISFKSRDKRIVGVWNLISVDESNTQDVVSVNAGISTTSNTTTTTTYDGTTRTVVQTNSSGFPFDKSTTVDDYSLEVTIYKDKTYTTVEVRTPKSTETCIPACTNNIVSGEVYTDNDNGKWYWLDSKKNKVAIQTNTGLSGYILRLASKELIIENNFTDYDKNVTSPNDSQEFTTTNTSKWTWEKTGKPPKSTTE